MNKPFTNIGIIGRKRSLESIECLSVLCDYLTQSNYKIIIEQDTANLLKNHNNNTIVTAEDFGNKVDLVIVVGGDGSLLKAAQLVVDNEKPVLGINRGRLGFLTDIHPKDLVKQLRPILAGDYLYEERFMLKAQIRHKNQVVYQSLALNDVVLLPGEFSHMIEYEIYINHQFVCAQSADGHIVATPTGSTAYALSGGGPILHPELDAVVLVPMFPHTLSSRPIVVSGKSQIEFKIIPRFETSPQVSCDGQERIPIASGDSLYIEKKTKRLKLLHPKNYNYFTTLRKKLHWERKLV